MQPFAGNYCNNSRFANIVWLCLCGEEKGEEQHLLSGHCEVYGDLTKRFNDLSDQNHHASFFSDFLAGRDQLEEKALGGGGPTTVGANSDSIGQNKPVQNFHLFGLNQLCNIYILGHLKKLIFC